MTKGVAILLKRIFPLQQVLQEEVAMQPRRSEGLIDFGNLAFHLDELADFGSEIGSDVSFCVYGGTALANGRGEIIQPLPTPPKMLGYISKTNYWSFDS